MVPGQRHDIHEGSYADWMHPSWRETSSVCTEAGNFHGGNHSRGAYRSQFETMNSYAALNKGSYRSQEAQSVHHRILLAKNIQQVPLGLREQEERPSLRSQLEIHEM